jgi:hypothetical protein
MCSAKMTQEILAETLYNYSVIRLRNRKTLARRKSFQRYIVKEWSGRLAGYPAFVLGNGSSILDYDLRLLDDYFSVGTNRIFKQFDPTILLWQDIGLWNTEHQNLHNLQCLKVCRDISDPRHIYYNFYLRGGPFRFDTKTHIMNGRGSTGPIAVEFAYALGCKPIIILGMDCKNRDGKTDFYGNNPHWTPHTLENCSKGLKFVKEECPVEIINCSDNGVFDRRFSLEEALGKIDKKFAIGRKKYISKLVHDKS